MFLGINVLGNKLNQLIFQALNLFHKLTIFYKHRKFIMHKDKKKAKVESQLN